MSARLSEAEREALNVAVDEAETCVCCGDAYGSKHVYEAVERIVADREAKVLEQVTEAWQTGEWSVLTEPIKADTQQQRIIGAAQAVTDWLRRYSADLARRHNALALPVLPVLVAVTDPTASWGDLMPVLAPLALLAVVVTVLSLRSR